MDAQQHAAKRPDASRSSVRPLVVLVACLATAVSAGMATAAGSTDPGKPKAKIRKVAGDKQHGTIGQPLPEPLVVEVIDEGGTPVPNVPVEFLPEDGDCDPPDATTDGEGKAKTHYIPGPGKKTQKIEVVCPVTKNFVKFIEFIRPFSPGHDEPQ